MAARQLSWGWKGPWGIIAAEFNNTNGFLSYPQSDVDNFSEENREHLQEKNKEDEHWYCLWLKVRTWFVKHWQEYVPIDIGEDIVDDGGGNSIRQQIP